MKKICILMVFGFAYTFNVRAQQNEVLQKQDFSWYVEYFNSVDDEPIKNAISNKESWEWMQDNIPFFQCPDKEIEQIYYYRWWVYRKHLKETPAGYVITEFLPEVGHASTYNTIAYETDSIEFLSGQIKATKMQYNCPPI